MCADSGRSPRRSAWKPAHGHGTAGQDPRGRRQDAARRQQPRDEGVLSGAVAVRPDLLRCLRAESPPQGVHWVATTTILSDRSLLTPSSHSPIA